MRNENSKEIVPNMHHEYFELVDKYCDQYGNNTVLLMQVGAFFEVYGLKRLDSDNNISPSCIDTFSNVCGLNISDKTTFEIKDKTTGECIKCRIMMAGFRDFTIDKYLTKLTDAGYTAVVYVQEKTDKKIIRKLDQIYSPGTFVSYETNNVTNLSNNIMCIWIERFKTRRHSGIQTTNLFVCGASVINIFTGEVHTCQYETNYVMNITTFDELECFVSIHSPSEVIIISDFSSGELDKMIQYSGIVTNSKHYVDVTALKADRCKNQKYMKEIIGKIYGEDAYNACSDFAEYNISTQSLCYLFDFVQEHNPKLISRIQMPLFNNTTDGLVLANHTLSQLNIISDNSHDSQGSGNLSSVMSFLNKCLTSMGKRLFQYQITHPTTNCEWLNCEYDIIGTMMDKDNYQHISEYRNSLGKIKDLDKFLRQLVIKTLYPNSINVLYDSLSNMQKIMNSLSNNKEVCLYLSVSQDVTINNKEGIIVEKIGIIKDFIDKHFVIDDCKGLTSMNAFVKNIIKPGISEDLDNLNSKYVESLEKLYSIKDYFNKLFQRYEGTDIEYVKIHEPEKTPMSLQMTSKRSALLKKIKDEGEVYLHSKDIKLENNVTFSIDDVKFTKASASTVEINIEIANIICRSIFSYRAKLNEKIGEVYLNILHDFEKKSYIDIEYVSKTVAKLDVLLSKTYSAKEYMYAKPNIVNDAEKSFFKATGMRHCLIERIQDNELYVDNDVSLGIDDTNGILLYGTNAVGKTSLIRSIGICVIMAQCGMYVPCTTFEYSPYSAIFSRILGNDNLFKGLSTFAVEMSELRTILNLSDKNSLILGDELCSGTETESALSIFVAGLMHLHNNKSSFIFATHFHEIVEYDEIKHMNSLLLKHLEVSYDATDDCLVYDRKLKNGSGPRIYGLEVCKSLYMNNEFIDKAFQIRNKYFADTRGILSGEPSKYNASKIKGICEICNHKIGTEIHHLQQQKDADEAGYIGNFHKNHKANLVSICESCHDKIDNDSETDKKPTIKKKTTKGTKLY